MEITNIIDFEFEFGLLNSFYFFKNSDKIFDYLASTKSFYHSCNDILMIGRGMDVETVLIVYLTYISEYSVIEPTLKTLKNNFEISNFKI